MNVSQGADLITAIYSVTDQLQVLNRTLEHIEAQLSSVSTNLNDVGIMISNDIENLASKP
jgi:prefoldin subunit 5